MMIAPYGPGCYELRRISTEQPVLFGIGGHAAKRMSSLLPKPLGTGTRNNSANRAYCLEHLADLEYRTGATATRNDAVVCEKSVEENADEYLFGT